MKKILFVILALTAPVLTFAQSALTGTDRASAIALLKQANALESTMTFDFKVTRHSSMLKDNLESSGHAAFSFPSQLCWETVLPSSNIFILDGNTVITGPAGNMRTIDISENRRFQSIARSASRLQTAGLLSEDDFTITVSRTDNMYKVEMVPLRRELRQLYTSITLFADAGTGAVSVIQLVDTGGDSSTIRLSSVKRGIKLPDSTFKTR